jgi:hypothetical protein
MLTMARAALLSKGGFSEFCCVLPLSVSSRNKIPAIPLRALDIPAFERVRRFLHRLRSCSPSTKENTMRRTTRRANITSKPNNAAARSRRKTKRELDALQIEEYIATNVRSPQQFETAFEIIRGALLTSILLREAGIEADGNDTAGKVRVAIAKLTKKGAMP